MSSVRTSWFPADPCSSGDGKHHPKRVGNCAPTEPGLPGHTSGLERATPEDGRPRRIRRQRGLPLTRSLLRERTRCWPCTWLEVDEQAACS